MREPMNDGAKNTVSACSNSFFISNLLRIILFLLIILIITPIPNISSAETENPYGKIVLTNLNPDNVGSVIQAIKKIDGRTGLARKIGLVRNIEVPLLNPLAKKIGKFQKSGFGRTLAFANKALVAEKVVVLTGEHLIDIQNGVEVSWKDHSVVALNVAAEISTLNPIGAIGKIAITDQIDDIGDAISERRSNVQNSLSIIQTKSSQLLSPEFSASLLGNRDLSGIETEAELISVYKDMSASLQSHLELALSDIQSFIDEQNAIINRRVKIFGINLPEGPLKKDVNAETRSYIVAAQLEADNLKKALLKLQLGVDNENLWEALLASYVSEAVDEFSENTDKMHAFSSQVTEQIALTVDDPIVGTNPPADDDNTNEDTAPVVDNDNEDNSDLNDEIKVVIGDDNPPEETGPTPEEIAEAERLAEEERLAELRRQEIARLEIERTAQFEVKLAREVQIQNIDNELALLEFGDQQEVQNALSLVTEEEQRLRAELNDTGLSAADQQRLQDLMQYQATLEDELDRISDRISSLEIQRDNLQSELGSANTVIIANSNRLNALDYDYNQFTEPTTSEVLIDWSDYEYELPPFAPTSPGPQVNLVGLFAGASADGFASGGRTPSDFVARGEFLRVFKDSNGAMRFELQADGGIYQGVADNPASNSYQYLSWGIHGSSFGLRDSRTNILHNIQNMHWLYGEATSSDYLNTQTGSASYSGQIYGDLIANGIVEYGAVTGGIGLAFNFGTDQLTGEGYFEFNSRTDRPNEAFNINGGIIDSGKFVAALDSKLPTQRGGNLTGYFFGPQANEVGGSIVYSTSYSPGDAFSVSGIFVGKPGSFTLPEIDPQPADGGGVVPGGSGSTSTGGGNTDYSNYRGLAAYIGENSLDPSGYAIGMVALDTIDEQPDGTKLASFNDTELQDLSNQVRSGSQFDSHGEEYSYVNWGSWHYPDSEVIKVDGSNLSGSQANWLVYSPTTDLPTTGSATYVGDAVGHTNTGSALSGDITLSADFANDEITGSITLNTDDNQQWLSSGFNTGIRRTADSSGFQTGLTDGAGGRGEIFGGFAGPNAEEVGGGWLMDRSDGSSGNGIFWAKQQ